MQNTHKNIDYYTILDKKEIIPYGILLRKYTTW